MLPDGVREVLNAVWIQWSVAFLPQEEQKRDLQECGALTFRRQVGQTKTCQPMKVVRQTSLFGTLVIIALRMRPRWTRKNRHQLPLSRKRSRSLTRPLTNSITGIMADKL